VACIDADQSTVTNRTLVGESLKIFPLYLTEKGAW